MNEEQVDKLVWKIHTKADAKRILLAVAAEARKEGIDEIPLRAILDWYMCSDPWPVDEPFQNQEIVTEWLDTVCKAKGYTDWVEAYHKMPTERLKEKP